MKVCPKCKKGKEITEFPKDKQNPTGVKAYCRVCSTELAAAYFSSNKQKRLISLREYYLKIKDTPDFRLKHTARTMVRALVRKGIIQKQDCFVCGKNKVQAHHGQGYEGENALKITWLCKLCHEREHHPSPF